MCAGIMPRRTFSKRSLWTVTPHHNRRFYCLVDRIIHSSPQCGTLVQRSTLLVPAPPPVQLSDAELEELGNAMAARITQLRNSTLHKLRIKGKAALLKAI